MLWQDRAPGGSRRCGALEADEDGAHARQRLDAIKRQNERGQSLGAQPPTPGQLELRHQVCPEAGMLLQDKAPGGGRKRGAPEADEDDVPDDVRQRLDAIKNAV